MVEITDRESAEAWLRDKPHSVQVAFAARCALRALPAATSAKQRTFLLFLLPLLHGLLVCSVAGCRPSANIRKVAYFRMGTGDDRPSDSSVAATAAANIAVANADSAGKEAVVAFFASLAAISSGSHGRFGREAAKQAAYAAAAADGAALDPENLQALFATDLWPAGQVPDGLQKAFDRLTAFWDAERATWGFWRDWYQGMLNGQPMDWALQEKVALIPEEDWQQGAAHIAGVIADIRARFELEKRITELEAELATASRSRLGIGGNNPPEPIEQAPAIAKELVIVWAPLQELKEQLQAEESDPSRIERIVGLLVSALKTGLGWCAAKGNLVVDTTIKWGIPAAGGGYLALNPDKIQKVIDAAESWRAALQHAFQ